MAQLPAPPRPATASGHARQPVQPEGRSWTRAFLLALMVTGALYTIAALRASLLPGSQGSLAPLLFTCGLVVAATVVLREP